MQASTSTKPVEVPEPQPDELSDPPLSFELCTTAEQVTDSLPYLRGADYLAFDCEGDYLGQQCGKISLLSLGAYHNAPTIQMSEPSSPRIFVYDALLLPASSLKQVLAFLSDPQIPKVVWDGRMDYTELLFGHGTKMNHVIDLQLVEVMSRSIRGETDQKRKERLAKFFRELNLEKYWEEYDQVHMLLGMGRCLAEYGLVKETEESKSQMKAIFQKFRGDYLWMDRPLSPTFIYYAAKDIHFIHLIYTHFLINSYLVSIEAILSASSRYVTIHTRLQEKPSRYDCFRSSPVLPLDIIEPPQGTMYRCEGCERKLSVDCYYHNAHKRNRMCRVCRVVGLRLGRTMPDVNDTDSWLDM